MASFDISKYREMFVEESEELFESADNILLQAENSETLSDEQMGQLFRDVHTLKGSGASVELSLFAEFTHDVENLMDKLRNHDIEFVPEMVETLIDGLDVMKELLHLEVDGELTKETFTEMTSELLSALRAYSNGEAVANDAKTNDANNQSEPLTIDIEESNNSNDGGTAFDNFNQSSTEDFNIGFYEDDLESQKSNPSYGFFADDDEEVEDEAYGFFNEELQEAAKTISDVPNLDNMDSEDFGFFDDILNEEPAASDSEEKVEKQQEASKSEKKEVKAVTPVKSTAKKTKEEKTTAKKSVATNNIRVNLDKIDLLMNNVGDLVITNAMLTQFTTTIEDNKVRSSVLERLELLERHIRDMQDSIMSIRMVPMESIYSKFPKVVRDISKKLNKKIDFKHYGDNVEIDKAMIEGLTDPLMHIVRNSLDHGLETPEKRVEAGKEETGVIIMSAEQANGQMIITIEDDGAGINVDKVVEKCLKNGSVDENQVSQMSDNDKAMLIFGAGVSTAESVTDISGRGVGMDVVKTNIQKLGGAIKLDTELGVGTTITIVLPLTLAILDGLDIAVGKEKYILPLSAIVESLQPTSEMIKKIGDGTQDLLMLRDEFIPVVRIHQLFNVETKYTELEKGMLIVVKSGNSKIAIFIDEFLHQHQVVVKPLDKNFRSVEGIGAATVRGDGSIGLILDILGIIEAQKKVERTLLESNNKNAS